ncbi:uncharacterized protein SPSK_09483 [Sporothrix schenckii 1099-18]|uniref:Luciferase domain-containing protein n=2 Tax=Sporothrix schenckii TaxID=29908 RepID=U7Q4Y2_SPOS1|nr:uncharacterized protein SPSK_09483 [Sporothrix schenckii 1099-18]ERT02878.1 hypothetical protein HMPREF1624_01181 [Sporothrix schenckii ATCC 58251]KJR84776.1 hypothetical protein SPSK_09483 [Sporothrix schenckii 1099-18]
MATLTVTSTNVDPLHALPASPHTPPLPPTTPSSTLSPLSLPKQNGDANTGDLSINMVIHQNPFSVTLDAWAMLAGSLLLVVGMHCMHLSVLKAIIVAVPVVLLIRNDYLNFLLLGPGGTPPTFVGYVRLLWFRLFALRDVYHCPPETDPGLAPSRGILRSGGGSSSDEHMDSTASELPYRPGPRPQVAGLAPQRQLDQQASTACYSQLRAAVEALTRKHPDTLSIATSCIEKHGFGLFARHPVNVWGQGEIFHIHDSEKSMHMSLHPDDIKEVLDKGWGQRHPLAFSGWVKAPLPPTFVMIYAPRDESDLAIIVRIVEAAIWYTMAQKIQLKVPPAEPEMLA